MRSLSNDVSTIAAVRAAFGLVVALLVAAPGFAQSGGISGFVKDPQQAVVTGAAVAAVNAATGARTTTVTDGTGRYSFASLPPGTYLIEVQAGGFEIAKRPGLVLAAAASITHDFVLAIAGGAETIVVTAEGTASQGYRVKSVTSPGSLAAAPLLDQPHTINVLPNDL